MRRLVLRATGLFVAAVLPAIGCGGTLDAGADEYGPLPVDGRNPVILFGDGFSDNWQGEYAILYASTGRFSSLAGIVVNTSPTWTSLSDQVAGWRAMVAAARKAGLKVDADPIGSTGAALVRPGNGEIDSTVPNHSEGARLILDMSKELAKPFRPLVVITGCRLTDIADAYLMEPDVANRIVVVSALGSVTKTGGLMGVANGEMDTWADRIVAERLRYVQVSTYYDQMTDMPASLLAVLPDNAFTDWIRAKQVWDDLDAADQDAVVAVANPRFLTGSIQVSLQSSAANKQPPLVADEQGKIQLVTTVDGDVATADFRQMLLNPATYSGR
jgi:hypothetical protein